MMSTSKSTEMSRKYQWCQNLHSFKNGFQRSYHSKVSVQKQEKFAWLQGLHQKFQKTRQSFVSQLHISETNQILMDMQNFLFVFEG